MPVIQSTYRSPMVLFNRHLQTIYPAILRKTSAPNYFRERISTPDDDFLDLDWLKNDRNHLVIISHGLEGNSTRSYMRGMADIFFSNGFDVLCWNYRGCSDQPNLKPYSYHSGATADLEWVIKHSLSIGYDAISLIGFSLGGNMTLKYLGEASTKKFPELKSSVVFSVPLNLKSCSLQIHKRSNFFYERRFLRSFFVKIREKSERFPEIDKNHLKFVKSVFDFDEYYTAPLSGFRSAIDYYDLCSSMNFIKSIEIPTLVVNALNDPFLGPECFEPSEFQNSNNVWLDLPVHGGHCGFTLFKNGIFWSEMRALEFIQSTAI
ncbi:MAG: alpha/beta fold hydrolase [Bacteroidetes bacterium]|nr:alpha/beta fold hydrolase [Bacteroidota bacterium]